MTIVNIQCNEEQKKEEVVYKIGQYFLVEDFLCVLARVDTNLIALIGVDNGNRWTAPVESCGKNISQDEFYSCLADIGLDMVTPVKSVNISYEL